MSKQYTKQTKNEPIYCSNGIGPYFHILLRITQNITCQNTTEQKKLEKTKRIIYQVLSKMD